MTRIGSQEPTFEWVPEGDGSAAEDTIELYESTGKRLDAWQANVLRGGLRRKVSGRPAAFECCVIVSRQNGKGEIIEALELDWLFLPQPRPIRLITHSAHMFETSREAFIRMVATIESTPDLDREVARISRTHGEEGITLRDGKRLQYRTRSGGGGGRGFTGDKIILDESMILSAESMAALIPTLSTRQDAQIWYLGSAGDKRLPTASSQLARVRRAGLTRSPDVAIWAWEAPKAVDGEPLDVTDVDWWYRTNPGLGIRITEDYVAKELPILDEKFARERLGVGDYPAETGWHIVEEDVWRALEDKESRIIGKVALAVSVDPERERASVCVTGRNDQGRLHTERIRGGRGIAWLAPYVKEVKGRQGVLAVVVDPNSPSRTVIPELKRLGITVTEPKAADILTWCGAWYDAVADRAELVHLGQTSLTNAVQGGRQEYVSSRTFRWSWKDTGTDVTPLWASTLSLGGFLANEGRRLPLVASA